ncbi:bifunctional 5,10-methylenetetrahydrofolate dehydrogenase/5,10-methenyltetrahydrofolate cyclohydrolase [Paramaledivibacter caminithermalis]|jgi:methylenetetrahydrofolate dehydrogenase (NADP+)/methenyltetrahydrofolate cyclohydrolase|uniref:Bifunctional protein FolD n=1 Tax=Paramaledivibacter caminithermalis (strain DSM 15212 / CIP 107654 / DViRD3) TaxID=1121301 RepID=A0A1M6LF86_PARC5|nr:bifunctional 5,10-methylenetetrahydrofolate dehydrogenase/5,10-methenyltetrahydrofolate cyclohydrolase [Paramaledivibacter caminithermalis]SHJ69842.1 methenyltetrahydrofolate cyclohydrolase /5,10-methylenetetrahydrofolate dehydrogenase (NADP+) [Paramaledivibacter caminithermalis DSM 15212]
MGQIMKGKPVADKITEELINEVEELKGKGVNPKLSIVRVGARPDDLAYEKGAISRCKKIGIESEVIELPLEISQEDFISELIKLNEDAKVHGILIFRPLPKHLDEEVIKYQIAPEKDIDCLSPVNEGKLYEGDDSGFPPCTPTAVMEMLKFYDVKLKGKDATVIGASNVVGKPAALMLLNERATISVCHSKTKNTAKVASGADILVVAVGRANFVKENFVKDGAVVIDVGINVVDGKLCGDVDFEGVKEKTSMITPVPGGVGSVTTSILAKHVIKACKLQNNL